MTAKSEVSSNSEIRWDLLLGWPFLGALALLIGNDWVLKALFGNFVTGKLSDFAGLFAFGVFGCAVHPRRRGLVLALVAASFAIWKSSVSQPLIEGWNALGILPVSRVVDPTDLVALLMLPLAAVYVRRPAEILGRRRMAGMVVAGISLIAFAATSYQTTVPYQEAYQFKISKPLLLDRVDSLGYEIAFVGARRGLTGPDSLVVWIPSDRCFDHVFAQIEIIGDTLQSALELLNVMHRCPSERSDEARLRTLFEDSVVARLRR